MRRLQRWAVVLAVLGITTGTGSVPAWAGRVYRGVDGAFELARITSAYRGGTTEVIAPAEITPSQPIQGETLLFGYSNLFPESVKIETFRTSQGWRTLQPADFTFKATVVTPEGTQGSFTAVVIRFAADKVALIQNAFVRITIQPMPGPTNFGDVVEGVILRAP